MSENSSQNSPRLFVLIGILICCSVAFYYRLPALKTFIEAQKLERAAMKRQLKSYLEEEKVNEEVTIGDIKQAAQNEDEYVRQLAIFSDQMTPEILSAMKEDESVYIRRQVASHPKTTKETLAILSEDEDIFVRQLVVRHPNTSSEVLKSLVKDSALQVRWEIAHNSQTPPEVLEELAKEHLGLHTKIQIIFNPQTPKEVIEKIVAENEDEAIKKAAQAVQKK